MNHLFLQIRNRIVSLWFYPIGILATVAGILIAIPALVLRARFAVTSLSFLWSRFLFLLAGRTVHVTGRENIAPGKAYLVVANHTSFLDIPGIITVLPDIIWVGREKLFRIPVFGTFLKLWGSIPIDTKSVMRSGEAISGAVHQARKARSVAIFPEGTRTPDGGLQEFKRGFTRILRNSDLDVLPLTLNGFYTLCPKDRWVLNPSERIEIIIHDPVSRDELIGKDDNVIAETVHDIVQKDHKGW
jgi:1-acyl-sn-glycerol-3-phosphate acyltransferase